MNSHRILLLSKSLRCRQSLEIRRNTQTNVIINSEFVEISDEVKHSNKPMVALESTIITHGLPFPNNMDTALQVEEEIRKVGALPATIAFINGKIRVGLKRNEIEMIAKRQNEAVKISRRDLPYVFSRDDCKIGGTTVSTTCIGAAAAKIPIFCTGGIGGVHRDFNESFDVSADLQELARLPVAVVSSGVKSILDIGKTLEYLETMGVCVATFNPTGSREFPAFFTSKSGFQAPFNVKSELEAAKLIHTNIRLGFNSGLLIAVPIPEEYAANNEQIDRAISEALVDLKKLKITGKKVTPFLLERINQLTGGNSLKSNVALILNNAKLSAKFAVELFKLQEASKISSTNANQFKGSEHLITVIGGTNLDNIYELTDEKTLHLKGVTQPSKFTQVLGGVGRNMTEALMGMGVDSVLISAIGNDLAGILVHQESQKRGFNMNHLEILSDTSISTGSYCAIFEPNGQINMAAGSMRVHDHITVDMIKKRESLIVNSEICVLDANIPSETIDYVCELCEKNRVPIWFNPTDIRKCHKINKSISKVTYISPNLKELIQIFKETLNNDQNLNSNERNALEMLKSNIDLSMTDEHLNQILKYMLNFVCFIILTRGEKDLILASRYDLNVNQKNQLPTRKFNLTREKKACLYFFPTIKLEANQQFVNESGAGDCTSSGIIAGILKGFSLEETIYNGLLAGRLALTSSNNVPKDLNSLTVELLSSVLKKNKFNIKKVYLE